MKVLAFTSIMILLSLVLIGIATDYQEAAAQSAPTVHDLRGKTLENVVVGRQVTLASSFSNNISPQTFTLVLEVRDSNNITTYLGWQRIFLDSGERIDMGMSWTPDVVQRYQLRAFIVPEEPSGTLDYLSTSEISVLAE